jgi:glycosyltransferase involved in cell wall biosynthesis
VRILHLASDDAWGGAERALLAIVDATRAQAGCEVRALLLNEGRLAQELRARGVAVTLLPERGLGLPRLVRALGRRLAEDRIDLVHAHRYKEILLGALCLPRRPLLVTVHGLEPWRQAGLLASLRTWACLFAARLAGARFAAVSLELTRRLARWLGPGHVAHVPNPLALPVAGEPAPDLRARCGWPADRPLVGFVGRLETVKGPDRLLDVVPLAPRDCGFVLIGAGSLAASLAERVAAEGLAGRVALIGEVPDAARYLAQLDVLAMTSRHEGLPMVLLEAAAAALPVVAYDVGGIAEILDGGAAAQRIPDGDAAAFAAALGSVLAQRETSRAAAAAWGASLRDRFAAARTGAAYLRLYRGEPLAVPHAAERV